MRRLMLASAMLLLAGAASAQEAPPDGYKNLWCSIGFELALVQFPASPAADLEAAQAAGSSATAAQKDLIEREARRQQIVDVVPALLEAASQAYVAAGFTTEQFEAARTELQPKVTEQVNGPVEAADFTFGECIGLTR